MKFLRLELVFHLPLAAPSSLGGIVKYHAKRMASSRLYPAYTMTHLHSVKTARALDGTIVDRKDDAAALIKRHDHRA